MVEKGSKVVKGEKRALAVGGAGAGGEFYHGAEPAREKRPCSKQSLALAGNSLDYLSDSDPDISEHRTSENASTQRGMTQRDDLSLSTHRAWRPWRVAHAS